jgi:branched-subunit amino acid transport protein
VIGWGETIIFALYLTVMIHFLTEYRLTGLVVGAGTFLIIGLFHPIVIRAEYFFGTRCWWVFLLAGIGAGVLSVCAESTVVSALAGVLAFTSLWSIKELFEQQVRVQKGWFPENPRRKRG